MRVELTYSYDGYALKKERVSDRQEAIDWMLDNIPDKENMHRHWIYSSYNHHGDSYTVVDYGSHRYFGRIVEE